MTTCHDIQLWWELPSIAHFCSLFRAAFDLLDFDIEDLEEAILTDGLDGSASPLLVELLVRLLQGCLPGRTVTPSNIDSCLRKLFRQKCQENLSWRILPEGDFRNVSLRKKVEILHALCDLRLEAEDVLDLLKNLETESLRVEPLGYDDNGATYWYFYGTRLYREDHSHYHPFRRRPKEKEDKKKQKRKHLDDTDDETPHPVWQVECFTEEDWSILAQRFEYCDSRLERGLLQTLKDDFLPEIPRLFEEKEKRRMMEFTSRRSSGRVQKLKEKKEEEERKQAIGVIKHKKKRIKILEEQEDGNCESKVAVESETSLNKEDSFEELLHSHPSEESKREKKKRKLGGTYKEVQRKNEWEEDVLQERNLSPQLPIEPVRNHKPYKRKEPKNHIRNHGHSKKNHRNKREVVENFVEELQPVSDASNKENCVGEHFSDVEDTVDFPEDPDKPKVFTGRKTNNSLSSLAFSLTPSTVVPETTSHIVNPSVMKTKVKSAQKILQTEDELRIGMYKILDHLGDHEDVWPFLEPVDETFAPNYYAVIRRPVYITKMEQRLDSGFYTSLSMFEADFKLMMDNCKLYNGPDSEYTHMAFNLEKVFAKLKEKYLETDFSSDDEIYIDMSFEQFNNKKKKKPHNVAENEVKAEPDKRKRGRKKKKVGRKPKKATSEKTHQHVPSHTKKKDGRFKTVNPVSLQEDINSISGKSNHAVELEDQEDDEADYDEPMLLVREDPYSQEGASDQPYSYQNGLPESSENEVILSDKESVKQRTIRKSSTPKEQNGFMLDEEKVSYFTDKIYKDKKKRRKSTSHKKEKSLQKIEVNQRKEETTIREPSPLEDNLYDNCKPSDSDIDSDQDGVLLYYNNDPETEEGDETNEKDIITDGNDHIEAFPNELYQSPVRKLSKVFSKDYKKHKITEKSHHHRKHHHHHKNKGKERESKHHHHHHKRRTKHDKDSPNKKVLKIEEVYQDIPHCKLAVHEKQPEVVPTEDDQSISPSKKKKARRKTKHHKSTKHKNEKVTKPTKNSSNKKKKVPSKKMAAINALSAVTEQTLKDITTLLDDPTVPRFNSDDMDVNGSAELPAERYESIAIQIEEDYRQKLQLDSTSDKKSRKRKRKKDDDPINPQSRKKSKKDNKADLGSDRKSDIASLDNSKELFKDIKDGRIKPGAIIKSKDIAKKEGQVKKDTKAAVEGKSKAKQNPFGKINKQENTKLTTLIAKAKESRVGLVPNSEMGDSPMLSLGSILQFGDIGSSMHSSREPNSPEEEEKFEKQSNKYESPYENRLEKLELKEESSHSVQEEVEQKEVIENDCEDLPDNNVIDELSKSPTSQGLEFKQDKATPNLSAWFRAFGGPKVGASPRKKVNGRIDEDYYLEAERDTDGYGEDIDVCKEDDEQIDVENNIKTNSPNSIPNEPPCSPHPPTRNNSPELPLSPVKPPETPWFHKADDKNESVPIWKKKLTEEDEDPYKFEEEELDRAREEAKKLEVERQRKASISSSGLSDPSPLNIDSDRSPAAFSSEGERSPMTRSPATRSPLTPGFGGAKSFSPVTEKSPGVTAYSPRYDAGLTKGFNQTNGPLTVGFYQDTSEKAGPEKKDTSKTLDVKFKESPIYSPTVPYVSPFYPGKEQAIAKQRSPARFGSFYSSVDSAVEKPKTPGYYPTSAPSTPTDKQSPVGAQNVTEEKIKSQYNYYNYDPSKPLTDQYKSTGSALKQFYGGDNKTERSPGPPASVSSPLVMPISKSLVPDKPDIQPPKKRSSNHKSQAAEVESSCDRNKSDRWSNKDESSDINRTEQLLQLPGNLANLSQVVSRIPQPNVDLTLSKPISESQRETSNYQNKPVHHNSPQCVPTGLSPSDASDLEAAIVSRSNTSRASQIEQTIQELSIHQPLSVPSQISPHLLGKDLSTPLPIADHQSLSHLQPPVAHQKPNIDIDRPGSRNMPPPHHSTEKPLSYLHQKTMWTSSLPSSIACSLSSSLPSSLSSLVTNATMASFALAGQKSFGSLSSEHLAQLGVDRAALASFAGRTGQISANIFSHDILQRTNQTTTAISSSSVLGGQNSTDGSGTHRSGGSSSTSSSSSSSSSTGNPSNNFDIGLARSYASIMAAGQASPLLVRGDNALTRSLSGASSPFLPQSPGLSAALGMTGSSRTPTPAHQQSLNQSSFPSISRDPRDPISQSHPSLQIPSLNTIGGTQNQTLNHLNAANLAYSSRDSLALMNQSGRSHLVGPAGSLVDPTPQHLYTQYIQRQQQLAQEEMLLRTAGAHGQLAAHQSMMFQQGLMSAAGYPSGYPHSLGLRSGAYQSMNRPWI